MERVIKRAKDFGVKGLIISPSNLLELKKAIWLSKNIDSEIQVKVTTGFHGS
jgi:Tat protein secretion system quality control protein TatD with DNase activity